MLMTRIGFTVAQGREHIFSTPIMEQAIAGAKARAADTDRSVSVVAHYADAGDRVVVYHTDGRVEKIWER